MLEVKKKKNIITVSESCDLDPCVTTIIFIGVFSLDN